MHSLEEMSQTTIEMPQWQSVENARLLERLDVRYDHVIIADSTAGLIEPASGVYGIFDPKDPYSDGDKEASAIVAEAVRGTLIERAGSTETDDVLSKMAAAVACANRTVAGLQREGEPRRSISMAITQIFEDATGKKRAAIISAGSIQPLKAINNNGRTSFIPLTPNKNDEKFIDGSAPEKEGDVVIDIIDLEDADTIFLATEREAGLMLGRSLAELAENTQPVAKTSTLRDRVKISIGIGHEGQKGSLQKNIRPARIKLGSLARQLRDKNNTQTELTENTEKTKNGKVTFMERHPSLLGALAAPAMMAGPDHAVDKGSSRWRKLVPGLKKKDAGIAAQASRPSTSHRAAQQPSRVSAWREEAWDWITWHKIPIMAGGALLAAYGVAGGLYLNGVGVDTPPAEPSQTEAAPPTVMFPAAPTAPASESGSGTPSPYINGGMPAGIGAEDRPPEAIETPVSYIFSGDSYEYLIHKSEAHDRLQVPSADFTGSDAHAVQKQLVHDFGPSYIVYVDAQGNTVTHSGKPDVYPIDPANDNYGFNWAGPARLEPTAQQEMDRLIIQIAEQHAALNGTPYTPPPSVVAASNLGNIS